MDCFTQFNLRGDADEQLRRAVRDGFKRAGLSPTQVTQALEWYRDHVRTGMDEAKLTESFAEFTASKGWQDGQRDAAVGVYGQVRDQGPAAVMSPAPSAEDDAATIARANELLKTDPAKYWADAELQEAQYEGLERQASVAAPAEASPPSPAPGATPAATAAHGGAPSAPARDVDQARHDEIVAMMRNPERSREYWASPVMQQESATCWDGLSPRPAPSRRERSPRIPAALRRQGRRTAVRSESSHSSWRNGAGDARCFSENSTNATRGADRWHRQRPIVNVTGL